MHGIFGVRVEFDSHGGWDVVENGPISDPLVRFYLTSCLQLIAAVEEITGISLPLKVTKIQESSRISLDM